MKKLIVIAALFAVMAGVTYGQTLGISDYTAPGLPQTGGGNGPERPYSHDTTGAAINGGMAMRGWESPQSAATAGRIRSAADDFIRPDSYTSARVGNWFGMTSFNSINGVNMGFAKKFENLYLAAYYGGSFGANFPNNDYTETWGAWRGGNEVVPTYTRTATGNTFPSLPTSTDPNTLPNKHPRPNNNAAILIGVADMGFRIAFASTLAVVNESDFRFVDTVAAANSAQYKNYKTEDGAVVPQFAWSMAKNLTEKGIKPYFTFDLAISRDYTASETYDGNGNGTGTNITNSQNYVQPIFAVGLGGFTFASKDGFSASADLDYILRLTAVENEFSYLEGGVYQTKKFKGIYKAGGVYYQNNTAGTQQPSPEYTEIGYAYNDITPSVSGSWNGDKLRLRFKLNLPIQITSRNVAPLGFETGTNNSSLVKNGNEQNITAVAFAPNLRLAAQWQMTSNLFLNLGGRINVARVTGTTTESEGYANGVKQEGEQYTTKRVSTQYRATENQLYLGFTLNATDNLSIEATTGLNPSYFTDNGSSANNNVNVFDTENGLFIFGGILVSLKF